jgi:spore coat polysaccharide biosynthesis protein SpsF (cytidylyltransferase family)
MLKTLGVVQARWSEPGSCAHVGRRLGGHSLLERVVRRVTDCQQIDGVVVVVDTSSDPQAIEELVPADVPVLQSKSPHNLGRFVEAAETYDAEAIVRVRGECACVDPVFIDRLVTTAVEHTECDYISYCSRDGRPSAVSPLGVFSEWCSAAALSRALREAKSKIDRAEVTRYIYSHPDLFNLRLIPVPAELDRDDLRLACERDEDWEHLHTLYDALGPDGLDWRRIAGLLEQHPLLREQMASLNRELSRA